MKTIFTLLHTLWVGSHLAIGYLVVPLLFAYAAEGGLSKQTAGNIAGDLFHWVMYLGLVMSVCWCVYLRRQRLPERLAQWLLVLLALSQFMVTPVIEAIKQQQAQWLWNVVGGSFGVWHGISSLLYLVISVLLLTLTWQRLQIKNRY